LNWHREAKRPAFPLVMRLRKSFKDGVNYGLVAALHQVRHFHGRAVVALQQLEQLPVRPCGTLGSQAGFRRVPAAGV
jgi:hypothetical protein